MSSEDFYLLVAGMLAVDLVVVGVFLYSDKRRAASGAKERRKAKDRVRPLSEEGREYYGTRLGKLDQVIAQGRYKTAFESADGLLGDVLAERGFPEEALRNTKSKREEDTRRTRLHAIDPEAAGAYDGARTRLPFVSNLWRSRKGEDQAEKALLRYRYVCEALIGSKDHRE